MSPQRSSGPMTGALRTLRRIAPWIIASATVGALLLGGLRTVAAMIGTMLTVTLLAEAISRSPSRSRSRGPGAWLGGVRRTTVIAAVTAWAAVGLVVLTAPDASASPVGAGHERDQSGQVGLGASTLFSPVHLPGPRPESLDLLIVGAAVSSGFAIRTLSTPRSMPTSATAQALAAARSIVTEHGRDSLSPFVLRPDKSFDFVAGGVIAYRVVGDTAVVSGDPVGPAGCAPAAVAQLRARAHEAGMRVVLYGASPRHLADYRRVGLRAMCVGEEAVVDPERFSLEGRAVRKLRQSVHRIERRGWEIAAYEGRDVDAALEREIDAAERVWRSGRAHLVGFAMSLGSFDPGVRPDDVYLLARSPEGDLRGVMRFLAHRGNLSLDTMRRVGETPNGLNEALICAALGYAREHDVAEVSLNYAGLAHLVRRAPSGGRLSRVATRITVALLRGRFQMDRLVAFNEKFSPEWRPRYLVYESWTCLPRSGLRALQAEGYLPEPRQLWRRAAAGCRRRAQPASAARHLPR